MTTTHTQGPQAGRIFPAVSSEYNDPETGVSVRQITDFAAHSNHLYFTNSGWYDEERRLLFNSDRDGTHNLYSADLESGVVMQLTDLQKPTGDSPHLGKNAVIHPGQHEAYFWYGDDLLVLHLSELTLERLYELPDGYSASSAHNSITADGRYICTSVTEQVDATTTEGKWNARPVTKFVRISVSDGDAEVFYEEQNWLSHTNTSPTQANLLTFAQEGPWDQTDQRIWALDMDTGETWKIRPESPGDEIGHEFWLSNGLDVGYHGRDTHGTAFYGVTRYDNEDRVEQSLPDGLLEYGEKGTQVHFHSISRELVVADGSPDYPYLILWRLNERGDGYGVPKLLVRHGLGTFKFGRLHVHPRFSADGSQVLFLGGRTEYTNLYLATVPDPEELPVADP